MHIICRVRSHAKGVVVGVGNVREGAAGRARNGRGGWCPRRGVRPLWRWGRDVARWDEHGAGTASGARQEAQDWSAAARGQRRRSSALIERGQGGGGKHNSSARRCLATMLQRASVQETGGVQRRREVVVRLGRSGGGVLLALGEEARGPLSLRRALTLPVNVPQAALLFATHGDANVPLYLC